MKVCIEGGPKALKIYITQISFMSGLINSDDVYRAIRNFEIRMLGLVADENGELKQVSTQKIINEEGAQLIASRLELFASDIVRLGNFSKEAIKSIIKELYIDLYFIICANYKKYGFRNFQEAVEIVNTTTKYIEFSISHAEDGLEMRNLTKIMSLQVKAENQQAEKEGLSEIIKNMLKR